MYQSMFAQLLQLHKTPVVDRTSIMSDAEWERVRADVDRVIKTMNPPFKRIRKDRPSAKLKKRASDVAMERRSDSHNPIERQRTDDLIQFMERWLKDQWDGKMSAAQTTFNGWQAKQLQWLAADIQALARDRYEISCEQSYSLQKKRAGRQPGSDVAKEGD